MRRSLAIVLGCAVVLMAGLVGRGQQAPGQAPAGGQEEYKLGPDSLARGEGVEKGKVEKLEWNDSKVFPGTSRDWWIYVPSQYDRSKPAAVMVFQDGAGFVSETGSWRVPIVLDNLIHKKEMPVTIGIFIDPGNDPVKNPKPVGKQAAKKGKDGKAAAGRGWRPTNRSVEYDSLGDRYSKFLIEEILPEVSKKYKITDDPEGRGICGSSSGGICSFTVAWERPDEFRKVISFVGSFADIRGGHNYPFMVRKTPKKPIRVFQQDGTNDLDNQFGNWFLCNQQMDKALTFAGYDHTFVIGHEGHNAKHGGAILPDALRWTWRK